MAISDKLTDEERQAVLRLMIGLALADGKLRDSEVRSLERMGAGLHVDVEELLADSADIDLVAERAKLTRPVASRVAVLCLVQLAHADGEYSREERDKVIEEVDLLGVDIELLDQMEDWAERGMNWELDADAIVEE